MARFVPALLQFISKKLFTQGMSNCATAIGAENQCLIMVTIMTVVVAQYGPGVTLLLLHEETGHP